MNELQIIVPNLHFIYEHWYPLFRNDVLNNYERICISNQTFPGFIVTFEDMVSYSTEWLYRVCSKEQYDDPRYYEIYDIAEDEGERFYNDCHADSEQDFRQDLFTVMKEIGLCFYTDDDRYHNVPAVGVW